MRLKDSRGFTLIELLVVVAILGIIAGIGIPKYIGMQKAAEKQQAQTILQAIYSAEQEYKSNNGNYYYSSNINSIVSELFDGVDDISGQKYSFSISGNSNSGTLCIRATRSGSTTLYLNHLKKESSC